MIAQFEKHISVDAGKASFCKYKNLHNLLHWHMEYEIIFVSCGSVQLFVSGKQYLLSKGMSAFIESREIHFLKGTSDSVTQVVKTSSIGINHIIKDRQLQSPIIKNSSFIKDAFYEIEKEFEKKDDYRDIIIDSIITRMIAEIFRTQTTSLKDAVTSKMEQDNKLLSWLAKNYVNTSFEDAAKYMNFSKAYFSKYFQKLVGMKFTQYLNILKVSLAIEKIASGEKNIANVAIACGFGTIRNFNRVFKNLTGYTPKHLPTDYVFLYTISTGENDGFDPTLKCSEIIE